MSQYVCNEYIISLVSRIHVILDDFLSLSEVLAANVSV